MNKLVALLALDVVRGRGKGGWWWRKGLEIVMDKETVVVLEEDWDGGRDW